MIITRSPLRISLGGGGTDLPSYYERFGGFLVAAAIDKYVYITVHETFVADLIVKYSKLERVATAAQLEHPIIREAFALLGMEGRSLELTSMADIPAGTGLGATTALPSRDHRENGTGCPPSPAWIDVVASAGSLPSRETVSIHSPTAFFAGRAKTKLSRARVMLT